MDEIVDQARLAETHFVLGRMHVDVHARRVEPQEQHVRRLAAMEQHVGIGLLDRMRDAAIAHRAAVDVQVLLVGAGAVVGRLRDPAVQVHARGLVVDAQRLFRELLAERLDQALVGEDRVVVVVARRPIASRRLAVVRGAQFDIRPRQRQRTQPFLDVAQFGALGAQELAPRRHVVEQIAHFDRGALRMRLRRHLADAAALDLEHRAMFVVCTTRDQLETADRRDRRQRLATEAERGDGFQVVERGDLAGGMARDGQHEFAGGDPRAIVADADQAYAAFFEVDVDPRGAGIERVLDEFLDHGGRTLDDLAGRDLVDEGVGKLADAHVRRTRRRCARRRRWESGLMIAVPLLQASAARQGSLYPVDVDQRRKARRRKHDQGLPPPPPTAPSPALARAAYSVPGGGWLVK